MAEVTRVPCVYGGHVHVATMNLVDGRTYLPLYTRHGQKWEDTPAGQRAVKRGEAVHIHRENIGPVPTEAESEEMVRRILAS